MGREIRMVPPNWQHPRDHSGSLIPMYNQRFDDAFEEWITDFDRVRSGALTAEEEDSYQGCNPLAAWLSDGNPPPDRQRYSPWKDGDASWFQVWETVSEGTPVTPPFATTAELIDYLVAGGDDWDRKRGRGGYTRSQAEAFVSAGWVPSMIIQNGVISNGIEISEALAGSKT